MSADGGVNLGVDGYEDVSVAGRGGFATVYKARQIAFNRIVAVKVLSGAHLDQAALRRFERERSAMGTVSWHPNIVTVYESGFTSEGVPYLTMEFVPFGSLADRLERRGPMNWREVVPTGVKLAGALETAHRAGVLHRDVKPENVLWSGFREPQLTDFGIARLTMGTQTSSGQLSLTVAHAPPEVVAGRRPSVQSDVYSLASTLFALLWGRSPFERDDDESVIALLSRIPEEPVPNLRTAGVPDELCSVIERAMAKDPADRHESALELGEDLRRVEAALGLRPTPVPLIEDSSEQIWAAPEGPNDTVRTPPPSVAATPGRAVPTPDTTPPRDPAPGGPPLARPAQREHPPLAPADTGPDRWRAPPPPVPSVAPREPALPQPPAVGPPSRPRRWPLLLVMVLILLTGGATLTLAVNRRSDVASAPAAGRSPTTVATPTTVTTVTSPDDPGRPQTRPAVPSGTVAPGEYATSIFRPATILRFEAGWRSNYEAADLLELVRADRPEHRIQIIRVQRVYRPEPLATIDQARGAVEERPSSLAEWLRSLPATTPTEAQVVVRAGLSGRQVDVTFSGYPYEGCGERPCVLLFQLEPGPGRPETFPLVKAQGEKARFYVFDVGADKVVVAISAPVEEFDEFVSASEQLLSIRELQGG